MHQSCVSTVCTAHSLTRSLTHPVLVAPTVYDETAKVGPRLPSIRHLFFNVSSSVPSCLPLFLCPTGVRLRAACRRLFLTMRRTWPSRLHRLISSTMLLRLMRSVISLSVIRCYQRILRILLWHLPSKPSVIRLRDWLPCFRSEPTKLDILFGTLESLSVAVDRRY